MGAYFGKSFMWKGIPSETYNLYIINLESSGLYDSDNGSEIDIYKKSIIRKPIPYTFGFSQSKVLEFELEFGSPTPLSAIDRDIIGRWLFGQQSYQKLQIFQPDLDQFYFNCIMVQSDKKSIGNLSYVFKAKVVCDSPWAWTFPKTLKYTYASSGNQSNKRITVFNDSSNSDYTYPQLNFTINNSAVSFELINTSDNNRDFNFSSLSNGEVVNVDNYRQIIYSTKTDGTHPNRLPNFSMKWFRLVPGVNVLSLYGGVYSFEIIYNAARKVGG